jgi:predicted MFS family arabinose efflux permease
MAFFYMAIPVGSALGYVFGGAISAKLGWRWPFYLVTIPGLLLGGLCLLMRDPRRAQVQKKKQRAKLADYLHLLRTPSYLLNTLAMTAMTFAIGGLAFWVPGYIYEFRHQPDLGRINTIFGAITVVAGLTATLLGGMLGDRLRARFGGAYFLVSGVAIALAFPFTVAFLYVPFPLAWVMIFCAVFLLFFNTGPANTALANVTHPSLRATAFALNILIIHAAGDAISPPLIGAIAGRWNMNVAFLVVSATMLLGAVFWLAGAKFLARDTERAAGNEAGA